jgi:hypothetical protein
VGVGEAVVDRDGDGDDVGVDVGVGVGVSVGEAVPTDVDVRLGDPTVPPGPGPEQPATGTRRATRARRTWRRYTSAGPVHDVVCLVGATDREGRPDRSAWPREARSRTTRPTPNVSVRIFLSCPDAPIPPGDAGHGGGRGRTEAGGESGWTEVSRVPAVAVRPANRHIHGVCFVESADVIGRTRRRSGEVTRRALAGRRPATEADGEFS